MVPLSKGEGLISIWTSKLHQLSHALYHCCMGWLEWIFAGKLLTCPNISVYKVIWEPINSSWVWSWSKRQPGKRTHLAGSHLVGDFGWLSQEPPWIICVHLSLSSFDAQLFIFFYFSAQAGRNGKCLKKQFMFARSSGSQSERGGSFGWCFSTDIREGGHGLSYSSSSKNSWYGGWRTKYKDWEEKKEKDQIGFKNLDVCDLRCLLTITCYCSSL